MPWNKCHFYNIYCSVANWEIDNDLLEPKHRQKMELFPFFFTSFCFSFFLLLTLIFSTEKDSKSNRKLCEKLLGGRKLTFNKRRSSHLNYFLLPLFWYRSWKMWPSGKCYQTWWAATELISSIGLRYNTRTIKKQFCAQIVFKKK